MLLFYVDILGLDVRAFGVVMTVYAVIDAIDNPILGHLSDRTRTRWGRRRPWLVVGAVVLAAAFVGFFSAPTSLEGLGLVAWFAFFAIACEAADSMYSANYGALLPELFPRERERAGANALRQLFQLCALALALAVTPLLTTQVFGTEHTTVGFTTTARIYAVIAFTVLIFMALSVRENPAHSTPERSTFFTGLGVILRTKLFWQIGVATACYLVPLALVLASIQLYTKYALGLPVSHSLYLMASALAVAAVGLNVWTRVVRRRGAPFAWRFAFVTNDLVQARVLDRDAREHGQHREGLYLSAFGFFSRLTGATAGLALGSLGDWFGYYSGANPGPDPGLAFRVSISVYPFVVAVAGVVLSQFVKVPGEEPETVTVDARAVT